MDEDNFIALMVSFGIVNVIIICICVTCRSRAMLEDKQNGFYNSI